MSDPTAAPLVAESDFFQVYERERRLRLTRQVAPIFGALLGAFFIGASLYLSVNPPQAQFIYLAYEMIGVSVVLFGIGTFAARRQDANLAAGSVTIASALAIITVYAAWALTQGIDPFVLTGFATFDLAIVLVGMLAAAWMTIATTALLSGFTVALLLLATPTGGAVTGQFGIVLAQGLIQEWSFAALLLVLVNAGQRTLRELGYTRQALDRVQRLDALKDQFITNVNHELRNPVMALLGAVQIIRLAGDAMSAPAREELFEHAEQAGDDLVGLLTSILDARKIDRGMDEFAPEVVPLRAAVEAAARGIDPREAQMRERTLFLGIPDNLAALAEPVRVRQILTNLLSNAVKYSEPGTPIEINAWAVAPDRARRRDAAPVPGPALVELTVRDHGLGIPPDQIPLLFNRFVRLERDLASATPGNGLGLHISLALAQSMGGAIWVESSGVEGEGATFHVRLPQAEPAPAAVAPSRAPVATREGER